MPRGSPFSARDRPRCRFASSTFSLMVSTGISSPCSRKWRISLKIQGRPNVALPIIIPSTPYLSNASFAEGPSVMSPLPMMGICILGLLLTAPIRVQSAEPLYSWQRVRPWIVSACIPASCNRSASSTMIFELSSQPRRVLTVTGFPTASTTALVIATILSG
uniref:Uncharacterized protein n=1 Tax=uncultured bacterium fosmid pJB28H11 TaxID=1478062 RepID=A0A0H3UAE7_9BACT|nr:hypothetical protein [uncultured bacterium fosmid pJB28H11]